MVRLARTIKAVALGIAIAAQPVAAQSSASLTHTVSVTVPPRVKVQFSALALSSTAVSNSSSSESTQAISLRVSATRAWVLSLGTAPVHAGKSPIRWSRDARGGFTSLATDVTVASGTLSAQAQSADVFLRGDAGSALSKRADEVEAPVVLTVTAP